MTQLNYQLPILGAVNSSEDPKVHDALQQVQTVVNGELGTDNVQDGALRSTDLDFGSLVTALPGSPYDGQIIHFLADAANDIVWQLRYRAASTSTHKWIYVGGGHLYSEVATRESTASLAYVDLTTVGPDIVVPLAGDYIAVLGCNPYNSTSGQEALVGLVMGATAAADGSGLRVVNAVASGNDGNLMRERSINGLAVNDHIKMQYRASGGTAFFETRSLHVRPVRVG